MLIISIYDDYQANHMTHTETQRLNYNCSNYELVPFYGESLYHFRVALLEKTTGLLYPNPLQPFSSQQKPSLQNPHITKNLQKEKQEQSCSASRSQAETFNFSLKSSRFIQMNLSSLFILHYLAHLLLRNLNSFDLSKDVNSPC